MMTHPTPSSLAETHLFGIGELVEAATYVQNDGWKWLGRVISITEDDGGAIIKGNVQTQRGAYWEYFRREHVRRMPNAADETREH